MYIIKIAFFFVLHVNVHDTHVRMHAYTHVRMYAYTHVRMYAYAYVYMYICRKTGTINSECNGGPSYG